MSKKIIFFGSGPVAAESLSFLSNNFEIDCVITKRKTPFFKGVPPVEKLAKSIGINVEFADNKSELETLVLNMEKHDLGIVIDYGVIISSRTISHFKHGIINSHFSILPEWRGADPITYSLLSGQKKTGVSLMSIDSGLDTGPLYATSEINLSESETNQSLTSRLIGLSNDLLKEYIPKILLNDAPARPQPLNRITTFSRKLSKDDGLIDSKKTATELLREIKAFDGWPKSSMILPGNISVIILEAQFNEVQLKSGDVVITNDNTILLGTKKNSIEITKLMPVGKREMLTKDFLNGYKSRIFS